MATKSELGIDLPLLTHSGHGISEAETLLWALETHRGYNYETELGFVADLLREYTDVNPDQVDLDPMG